MARQRQLIAGVTASGAVLCLTLSAADHRWSEPRDEPTGTLTWRVDELRNRLATGIPTFAAAPDAPTDRRALDNIVQFFNFFNCLRPGWRNC